MYLHEYCIAGNFRGSELVKKTPNFCGENFCGFLAFAVPKDTTPPIFAVKNFVNSHKTAKFGKVFSLESFPLYGRLDSNMTKEQV